MSTEAESQSDVFERNLRAVHTQVSRLFFWLLLAQWLLAVALALIVSPYTWTGRTHSIHIHVYVAAILGGAINALPLVLLRTRPDWWLTRYTVAVVQMLWSAILIHITGGRIETHFHVFGSLAFIAFYRDWRLLLVATVVLTADHLARGLLWPESVYGIANPEWWRFLEHAAWVTFEDVVLVLSCQRAVGEMMIVADREASLERLNADIEHQVNVRTGQLEVANRSLADEMKTRLIAEAELRQAQKLEAVGRLASGVAHEINTPVQFVSDSVAFLREASAEVIGVLEKLQRVQRSVLDGEPALVEASEASDASEAVDLPYLFANMPKAFDCVLEGLDRVSSIVRSMNQFAHPDSKEMTAADLNTAIESTLTIARNEYKYVAELETELGPLPPVVCHVGDVNQMILNIVVNAAHAIGDAVKGTDRKGRLHVRTQRDGDDVVVSIADTGGGIPDEIRAKVFDPFFTTKEVGRGTGQGLTIARSVVEKHRGQLRFETEVGKGTTFFIRLPIDAGLRAFRATAGSSVSERTAR